MQVNGQDGRTNNATTKAKTDVELGCVNLQVIESASNGFWQ